MRLIMLVICEFLCVSISAKDRGIHNNIFFYLKRFEHINDSIYIDMDFGVNEIELKSDNVIEFVPTIQRLEDLKNLPKISLMGNTSYKVFKRTLALMSKEQRDDYATSKPYKIIKGNDLKNKVVRYKMQTPFEKWMDGAWLLVKVDFCGCGNSKDEFVYAIDMLQAQSDSIEQTNQEHIDVDVEEAFILKNKQEKLVFYYALGDSILDLNRAENRSEYEQLENILSEKKRKLIKINISGYASPEGLFDFNQSLSKVRALMFQNYMLTQKDSINKDICEIFAKGEDWEDLKSLINNSNLDAKEHILDIIENTPIKKGRESKLMQYQKGSTYQYLQKEMFPLLRKVEICIDSQVECRESEN